MQTFCSFSLNSACQKMLKKIFLVLILVSVCSLQASAWRGFDGYKKQVDASDIGTNESNFNGNFNSSNCDDVQECLDTIDNFTILSSEVDGVIGNEIKDVASTRLTRSGSGTEVSPYLVDLNLANPNTWTAAQGINYDAPDQTPFQTAFQALFTTWDDSATNEEPGFSAIYGGISDSHATTGTIEDSVVQKSGFEIGMFRTFDSDVNWVDGIETIRGYASAIQVTGSISGAKHNYELIGMDMSVLDTTTYSGTGTHLTTVYGNKITVTANGVITGGTVTRNTYGEYIQVSGSTDGTSTAYGIYINDVGGADTNYAINSQADKPSFLKGSLQIEDSLQVDSIVNDTGLAAGTYTPTLTNTTNVAASTAYECQYMRVGNTVTVSGKVDIDPTSAGSQTVLGMSLPISSNLGAEEDLAGSSSQKFASGINNFAIYGDATNDRAKFEVSNASSGSNISFYFTFTYQVI